MASQVLMSSGDSLAEFVSYEELIESGSWGSAKETGKLRVEGKD
jgi:ribosome-binding ATPase YchF (GTP1/OBG family)